ncbi:DNA polymerase III subunit chi, partial [Salmonella enterica]|uniref:DNA polymerase III subunit chi n=1 Tax=Salmonella enterica TaxID=28901 RepID=UPI00398C5377
TVNGLRAVEQLVCESAAERWRAGKRELIACEDGKEAIRLDEALWARPAESFVPNNLAGEGTRGGAPVEIAWPQKRNSSPRDLLISLRTSLADFATAFTEVVDFVPYEETLKQRARERSKANPGAGL